MTDPKSTPEESADTTAPDDVAPAVPHHNAPTAEAEKISSEVDEFGQ